ncbi:MAG: alpha/beta hydrolase [Thermaerobacter sp.]|nr:alpha/beta hydrolase [Thermaerobacter sp.]
MPYAPVNGITLYYEEAGQGEPWLLLHGATGSIDQPSSGWAASMPAFAREYRAIAIEHRGHGRSTQIGSDLSYDLIAEDLAAFIDLMNLGPVHIAGVSDGAIVALHLGMYQPHRVKTLVCVGANFYNDDMVREANRFADVQKLEQEHPEWIARLSRLHDRNKAPGWWRRLYQQVAANLAVNPCYGVEDLHRIKAPTLLVAGENDLWGNLAQMVAMRRHIERAEMLIVNNGGHVVQFTHQALVEPVVLDFLRRHRDPAATAI